MDIVLSNTNDTPIYKQIYDQIAAQIIRGDISSDSPLPAIRTVAAELKISVIPVKRAWEALEREGFIRTMVGKGTFVATLTPSDIAGKRHLMTYEQLSKDILFYKSLGITYSEMMELISKHYIEEE